MQAGCPGKKVYSIFPKHSKTPTKNPLYHIIPPRPSSIMSSEASTPVVTKVSLDTHGARPLVGATLLRTNESAGIGREERDELNAYLVNAQLYNASETHLDLGDVWTKVISLGPVTLTISFDTVKKEGSIAISVAGVPAGTAKFSKSSPLHISVGNSIAGGSVDLKIHDDGSVWLEMEAHAVFKKWKYGPKKIWPM